ncbi:hypothetical protein PR202_gb12446 [Eleusine coracana subsp. coracana]|uniref:DUF1618 domain-containing protein n=1 Tax=Eleusine coracana subsp. coracana TaxID=191504 RepID=A0AAV5ERE1_ELECO|nr:hypothetical protein QOZ80_7BG0588890 [Eleusine coracana subsp. coracana]GJN24691.1 hypothetical protein PR202_gb12446 [Eleusine coracana subsp. coracana]
MLERFIFRRDDDNAFPDADTTTSEAPTSIITTASGTTTFDASFRIAFVLAEPPLVSRLYAQLPEFPGPDKQVPLAVLASHRHLVLLRVGIEIPTCDILQDLFVYDSATVAAHGNNPSSSSSSSSTSILKRLPTCTKPMFINFNNAARPNSSRRRWRRATPAAPPAEEEKKRRLLAIKSLGIVCRRGEEEEFAVAELQLWKPNHSVSSCISVHSRTSSSPSCSTTVVLPGEWKSVRVPILLTNGGEHSAAVDDDAWQLSMWQTDAVIPFNGRYLCWVDYFRGILLCDLFTNPATAPAVFFIRFPLHEFPSTPNRSKACSWFYRCATAVDDEDTTLKFVDVARDDGIGFGPLKPGAWFTVTGHTLRLSSGDDNNNKMVWSKDYTVISDELWAANPGDERLPREILMFPQVNMHRPHVVQFLIVEFGFVRKKMWVVAIDMTTKIVESFYRHINGREDRGTVDADFTQEKSSSPSAFLPCQFSKFLQP